jgi:hypothetical protein
MHSVFLYHAIKVIDEFDCMECVVVGCKYTLKFIGCLCVYLGFDCICRLVWIWAL